MAFSERTRLGRYEIRSQLGTGGIGEVYLAQDASGLESGVRLARKGLSAAQRSVANYYMENFILKTSAATRVTPTSYAAWG